MRAVKLLALLALTGCALAGVAILAMTLEPAPDSEPSRGDAALTAEEYHELVRASVPSFANRDDGNLDQIAAGVCKVLRSGGTWLHVIKAMTDAGATGYDAGSMGQLTVARACPDQISKLPAG